MSPGNYLRSLLQGMRAGKFLSVGVTGAVFDTLILTLVVEVFSVRPVFAKVASAEAAIILMFVINDRWTFSETGSRESVQAVGRRFLRSNVVRAGGVAVALTALFVLHEWLGVWYPLANVLGIGVGFIVNYVAESLFTWRVHLE